MSLFKFVVFILFFNLVSDLNCQIDSLKLQSDTTKIDSLDDTYNEAKFSIQSGNNIVQIGQVMSTSELYARPAISFYHKTGIYIGGNLTLMPTDTQNIIDNFSLSGGYDKELKKNFTIGIDYTFSHYYSTKQVTSSAEHIVRPYVSWENKYIMPTLTPSILIGDKVDFAVQLDFTHILKFKSVLKSNDRITIPVSIGMNSGTSEFYNMYSRDKRGGRPPITDTSTSTMFGLTSIYSMVGVKYKIKQTSLSFNTSYYLSRDNYSRSFISNPLIFRLTLAYYLQ